VFLKYDLRVKLNLSQDFISSVQIGPNKSQFDWPKEILTCYEHKRMKFCEFSVNLSSKLLDEILRFLIKLLQLYFFLKPKALNKHINTKNFCILFTPKETVVFK